MKKYRFGDADSFTDASDKDDISGTATFATLAIAAVVVGGLFWVVYKAAGGKTDETSDSSST